MRYILLMLTFTILTSENCNKKKKQDPDKETIDIVAAPVDIPDCIQLKIDSIKKLPVWNPPAEVHEYRYMDKKVFLFSSDCCDFFNPLFDGSCKYICSPHGGIAGKGDMKCLDFEQNAKHVKLVWKDTR